MVPQSKSLKKKKKTMQKCFKTRISVNFFNILAKVEAEAIPQRY